MLVNPVEMNGAHDKWFPLFTVAICTRNRAALMEEAARSVLAQIRKDTDLLIVDNGSTDHTGSVAASLRAANPVVSVWREERPGVAHARNTALAKARGEFVIFLDDDETAEPGWLAAYAGFILQHQERPLGCVGGPAVPWFEAAPPSWIDPAHFGLDLGEPARILTGVNSLGAGNSAYRKSAVQQCGGFCPALARHEDSELNTRLQLAGYEVWWLPGARIQHRIPLSRLTLIQQSRQAFSEGRSAAVVRLRQLDRPIGRWLYCLARSTAAPFHIALKLILAGVSLPWAHGRTAARTWLHVPRIAGVICGLWSARRGSGKSAS